VAFVRRERVGGSREKAQLAPGSPTIRDLDLIYYTTAIPSAVQVHCARRDLGREEWPGDDGVGNHHVKILIALYALRRLMRHLPESGSGLHVNDLFLLAMIAGNSHGDISPVHLYLGHDRPPASSCNFRLSGLILSRRPAQGSHRVKICYAQSS
jgi:hypothetical protein